MAVKIRLQRGGSKHAPVYRLVAADSRARRDGRFLEKLGTYNPKARGAQEELNFNIDRIDHWLSVGAQMSDTSRNLIKKARKGWTGPAKETPAAVEAPAEEAKVEATPEPEKAAEEIPVKEEAKEAATEEPKAEETAAPVEEAAAEKPADAEAEAPAEPKEEAKA